MSDGLKPCCENPDLQCQYCGKYVLKANPYIEDALRAELAQARAQNAKLIAAIERIELLSNCDCDTEYHLESINIEAQEVLAERAKGGVKR
jgi:hypothetical protein